jgi:PAS domain S-box-containing protein
MKKDSGRPIWNMLASFPNYLRNTKYMDASIPWPVRYGFALISVIFGALLRLVLTNIVGPGLPTYITFYPSVMLAALFAGIGPGLIATLVSALIVDFWLLPPSMIFVYQNPVDLVGQVLFVLMGIFMVYIAGQYKKINFNLEKTVAMRTSALNESNEQLKREIEGRKIDLAALHESEQRSGAILNAASESIWLMNLKGDILSANDIAAKRMGMKIKDLVGKNCYGLLPKDVGIGRMAKIDEMVRTGKPVYFEDERAGIIFDHTFYPVTDSRKKIVGVAIFSRDITQRKLTDEALRKNEEELRKLNRTLKAISDSNHVMMRATNESEYMNEVCKIIIKDCGHFMVWIGFARNDEERSVQPVAQAGFEEGYLKKADITWADTPRGKGPTGTAIRSGKPQICKNMQTDPRFSPWRDEAVKRGYSSSIVLPLKSTGRVFGAINIYSKEPDPFSEKEVELLTELADDLAYGITSLRLSALHAKAEKALQESEEKFKLIATNTPDHILMQDINLRYTMVINPQLGLKEKDMIGRTDFDILSREDALKITKIKKRILKTGKKEFLQLPIASQSGETQYFDGAYIPRRDEHGNIDGIIGYFKNITVSKKLENLLQARSVEQQTILDSTPAMIFYKDKENRFLRTNRSFESSMGLAKEKLEGRSLFEIYPKEQAEAFWKDDIDVIKSGKPKRGIIEQMMTPNGTRILQTDKTPYLDESGNIKGIIGFSIDITERSHAEETQKRLLKEKETLLKEIHHRVKNNMQMISSLLRLQSRRIDNKYIKKVLDDSQNRIKSMALVHEILYKSENLTDIDINEYIRRIVNDLLHSYKISDKDIRIDFEVDKIYLGIDTAIPCGLIVNELVSNSLKYAFYKRKEGRITIMLKDTDSNAELVVRDDGIGLPSDFDISNLPSLGLQLVDTFTRQLGGKLEIKSKEGTEFKIIFPTGKNG